MYPGELLNMDQLLVTRNDAAALLNLSTRSIDYLVAKKRLPSRKFGKRRLIPREAVERIAKHGCGRITPLLTLSKKPTR
jgi:excisionase family DNA binding protein